MTEHHTEVDWYPPGNPQHVAFGWGWRCSCSAASYGWNLQHSAETMAARHENETQP
jgi:hypothetical protein